MKTVVIGTAGHIDHGKSALVRALTGIDPDRLKEEQARGITIDLGFAHLTVGDVQIAFVDVPGHERFVRNMLAGAGGIDAVLLVVAANESVKPQTREHFEICRLLGLDRGVIVLTKADLVDAETLAIAEAEVRELAAGSFLEGAPVIPVSARTGQGLDALRAVLAELAGQPPRLHRAGVIRLPVDRAFIIKGFGVVVTGTLVSGRLASGDELAALPGGATVRVRGLQVHGRSAEQVTAPQRTAVNVTGADAVALSRGVTLATPDALAVTKRADVHLRLLAGARPLPHGARVRVHHGTSEIFARVSLAAVRAPGEAAWRPAAAGDADVAVPAGGEALARLRFASPAVLTRGDRLILRAASPVATIGGARVLDPEPPAGGVRRPAAFARFQQIDDERAAALVDVLVAETGGRGFDEGALVRRAGLDRDQARTELEARLAANKVARVGARFFAAVIVRGLSDRVLGEIERYHRDQPGEPGIPRETLRSRTAPRAAVDLFDHVVAGLAQAGKIAGGDRIALAGRQRAGAAGDSRARDAVEARFRSGGLAPPDSSAVGAEIGLSDGELQRVIRALVQEGRLVRAGDLVFHCEPLAGLKTEIQALRHGQPPGARIVLDVSSFKTRHGLSRKFAIPLLEYLDRERVTRRVGDVRIVL